MHVAHNCTMDPRRQAYVRLRGAMENNVQNYLLLDPANPVHCLLRQRGGMIATAVFFGSPEGKRLETTFSAILLYRSMCECGAAGLV